MAPKIAQLITGASLCLWASAMLTCVPAQAQVQTPPPSLEQPSIDAAFGKFVPHPSGTATTINYDAFNEALNYFVFDMGNSSRDIPPNRIPDVGTRMVYGHESRLRLEGNRVLFSYFSPEFIAALGEFRQELEALGSKIDIASLPRNEQLAYWINLHNLGIIEQIGLAYPLKRPSKLLIGQDKTPLDEAKFFTVAGVRMSPRDIRTKIVYPNWKSPAVIYGFYRGEIGGPSIQRNAYSGKMVGLYLNQSAQEFINSLRGTQISGNTLLVSKIYDEARPFYFKDWEKDIRYHLNEFASPAVIKIIDASQTTIAKIYEDDIADMEYGEHDPNYNMVMNGRDVKGTGLPPTIAALLREYVAKEERLEKRQEKQGKVYMLPLTLPGDDGASEVD